MNVQEIPPPPGYGTPHVTVLHGGATDQPEHLHHLDLDHLLTSPPPEHDWVWDGYIERRTLTVLHGDGGTGKSILAAHLCRAITTGGQCLGRQTAQGNVLIIDAENPLDEIHRRLHALDFKTAPKNSIHYYRAADTILGTSEHPDVDALVHLIQKHTAIVVILDSQRGLWRGEEKDAIAIRPFYRQLQTAAEALDAAIILIHHDRRTGDFSGSSDIHNSADTRLWLERPDRDKPERILHHAKARSSAELQPSAYTFTFDRELGLFTFTSPREPITDAGLVLEALEVDEWLTVREISPRAGLRESEAKTILWQLVKSGDAQTITGPAGRAKRAICFRRTHTPEVLRPDSGVVGRSSSDAASADYAPAFTPPLGGEAGVVEQAELRPPPAQSPDDIPW